jgi:hypothetical protein
MTYDSDHFEFRSTLCKEDTKFQFHSQLRGAQITLQELQKGSLANAANLNAANTQEPLKEISYADDDSDDEEQSDTKKWEDADIHKVLTINKYLVKESGGAKDSDERKPPLYIRIQTKVKVR